MKFMEKLTWEILKLNLEYSQFSRKVFMLKYELKKDIFHELLTTYFKNINFKG